MWEAHWHFLKGWCGLGRVPLLIPSWEVTGILWCHLWSRAVGPPVLSSLFSAPSQCLAIVGRRRYLLVRDHGAWPAVVHAKMCGARVDGWGTDRAGCLWGSPPDGRLSLQQPAGLASLVVMSPPGKYVGAAGELGRRTMRVLEAPLAKMFCEVSVRRWILMQEMGCS